MVIKPELNKDTGEWEVKNDRNEGVYSFIEESDANQFYELIAGFDYSEGDSNSNG